MLTIQIKANFDKKKVTTTFSFFVQNIHLNQPFSCSVFQKNRRNSFLMRKTVKIVTNGVLKYERNTSGWRAKRASRESKTKQQNYFYEDISIGSKLIVYNLIKTIIYNLWHPHFCQIVEPTYLQQSQFVFSVLCPIAVKNVRFQIIYREITYRVK